VPGVTRVVESDRRDGVVGYEIDSDRGADVRRDLARTVVSSGVGLLELRPMRMSLEQIFLSLTTEESRDGAAAADDMPYAAAVAAQADAQHEEGAHD
jgi:ABC-2 type transport system ATP-binding protein